MKQVYDIDSYIRNSKEMYGKKKEYQCQNCQIYFQNQQQLYNHHKNFCVNSGFDTLVGLNIKLKNPPLRQKLVKQKSIQANQLNQYQNGGLNYLQNMGSYKPYQKQLQRDMKILNIHKQTTNTSKPYYLKTLSKRSYERKEKNYESNTFAFQSQSQNYINKSNKNEKLSKSYSLYQSNESSKIKKQISPPTQDYQYKFSILNKSNNSIKNMSLTQKRQYILKKLLQLQDIKQNYSKNGGKDKQFLEKINNMIEFYQKYQGKQKSLKFQEDTLIDSRVQKVSTPILKLRNYNESIASQSIDLKQQINQKLQNLKQSKNVIKQKTLWQKKQDKMKKTIQQSQASYIRNLEQKLNSKYEKNNQIIVIPYPQPQTLPQNRDLQANNNLKLLQEMMKMKGQQNKKLISILQKINTQTKSKYDMEVKMRQKQMKKNEKMFKKLQAQNKRIRQQQFRIAQLRQQKIIQQSDNYNKNFRIKSKNKQKIYTQPTYEYNSRNKKIENARTLNLQKQGFVEESNLQIQDKILRQIQQQQRDQLQVFSHLPKQLQELKIQSMKKSTEARAQVQKQIYAQKMQKLKLFQVYHGFSLQRKLNNEDLQIQNRKMSIQKLIKKQLKQFTKNAYRQNQSSSQQQVQNKIKKEDEQRQNSINAEQNKEQLLQTQ